MGINFFLDEMKRFLPGDARIMNCQFRGDPNSDSQGKWKARVTNDASILDSHANVYLCVSAMKRNSRGEFRRRKENFAGGLLLMIDDLGTGKGAKWPLELLDPLPPTALIETSPKNYQAVYFFNSLIEDMEEFDALIRAFIQRQFLGVDTGQAGVNRVFRPPYGINGKAKYGGNWPVGLTTWNPERRYSIPEIAKAFKLSMVKRRPIPRDANLMNAAKADRVRFFIDTLSIFRATGWLKKSEPDYSGWIPMRCPWTANHTGGVDNGAGITIPAEDNGWNGGFRCHHGHCEHKGWRELTDWLTEQTTEVLGDVNMNAMSFGYYEDGICQSMND